MLDPMEGLLDSVEWVPTLLTDNEEGKLYATHEGILRFAGVELRCYTLINGLRVINTEDAERLLGVR